MRGRNPGELHAFASCTLSDFVVCAEFADRSPSSPQLLTWTNEYTPNCPMCRETVTFFTIHESHSGPLSQPPTRDTSLHSVAREILRHSASLSRKNREARGTPSVSRTSTMMDARPSQEVNCGQIASSSTNTHASDSGRKTLIDLRNVAGRDLHAPGADEGSRRAEEADKATRSARDVHMPHDASGDSQDNFQVHRTQARRMTAASLGPMASSLSAELTFSHECRGISSRRIHEAQRHETRSREEGIPPCHVTRFVHPRHFTHFFDSLRLTSMDSFRLQRGFFLFTF